MPESHLASRYAVDAFTPMDSGMPFFGGNAKLPAGKHASPV